mmetsp:Transcript_23983/g.49841  ORF Transcript_23983/g.49841 Transcript_23983/m.49841 type:complete len:110 (+) Transcript_23983:1131-1460(+)
MLAIWELHEFCLAIAHGTESLIPLLVWSFWGQQYLKGYMMHCGCFVPRDVRTRHTKYIDHELAKASNDDFGWVGFSLYKSYTIKNIVLPMVDPEFFVKKSTRPRNKANW